jgi:hypothetical protein
MEHIYVPVDTGAHLYLATEWSLPTHLVVATQFEMPCSRLCEPRPVDVNGAQNVIIVFHVH